MPTLRLGVDDFPVIVVLVVLVSIERLKNELEPVLTVLDEYGSELNKLVSIPDPLNKIQLDKQPELKFNLSKEIVFT